MFSERFLFSYLKNTTTKYCLYSLLLLKNDLSVFSEKLQDKKDSHIMRFVYNFIQLTPCAGRIML